MPAFLFSLAVTALATLGSREAVRVAQLSVALGQSAALLAAAWLACIIASLLAARLGAAFAQQLPSDGAAVVCVAALLMAAVELVVRRPVRAPVEPTRSLGAVLLVLGSGQLFAAAAFLVFALAAVTGASWPAAAGGALGSGAALTAAWSMGGEW